jgi:hypothetical protein
MIYFSKKTMMTGVYVLFNIMYCRTIHTRRGCIKRIRFAPGRGNTKFAVLYHDGIDVFELKEGKVCV